MLPDWWFELKKQAGIAEGTVFPEWALRVRELIDFREEVGRIVGHTHPQPFDVQALKDKADKLTTVRRLLGNG